MKQQKLSPAAKKEISRLRSEVRKLSEGKRRVNAPAPLMGGNYWTATGMPWVGSEGRKAVLSEFFWQPISFGNCITDDLRAAEAR